MAEDAEENKTEVGDAGRPDLWSRFDRRATGQRPENMTGVAKRFADHLLAPTLCQRCKGGGAQPAVFGMNRDFFARN